MNGEVNGLAVVLLMVAGILGLTILLLLWEWLKKVKKL